MSVKWIRNVYAVHTIHLYIGWICTAFASTRPIQCPIYIHIYPPYGVHTYIHTVRAYRTSHHNTYSKSEGLGAVMSSVPTPILRTPYTYLYSMNSPFMSLGYPLTRTWYIQSSMNRVAVVEIHLQVTGRQGSCTILYVAWVSRNKFIKIRRFIHRYITLYRVTTLYNERKKQPVINRAILLQQHRQSNNESKSHNPPEANHNTRWRKESKTANKQANSAIMRLASTTLRFAFSRGDI